MKLHTLFFWKSVFFTEYSYSFPGHKRRQVLPEYYALLQDSAAGPEPGNYIFSQG